MKRILLIATGGTIASSESSEGLTPALDVEQLVSYLPEMQSLCQLAGVSIMSIDSTNMNPKRIGMIAQTIAQYYDAYDGFVIAHGTDTMAYSAAALTDMLRHLNKPVVLLRSDSVEAPDTDAKKNLSDAIRFACEDIRGVFVVFDGIVIEGSHAMKCRTRSRHAFESINFPVVAQMQDGTIYYTKDIKQSAFWYVMQEKSQQAFSVQPELCTDVFVLKLFPGIGTETFNYIKKQFRGVVIESFGIGGIPNESPNLLAKIRELAQAGVAVVITTQCLYEGVDLDIYAVGKHLAEQPIIVAETMTTEAIVMKLMWSLAHFDTLADIKAYIQSNNT